ncbi:MAG TPA: hypothetical protein DDY98_07410 [Ruminococcaceae bacterium]|nr:hypothetical protein [Oscillospiraceae bacterium]
MTEQKKRRGNSKIAFPLGLVIIIFAVIGVIFAVSAGISGVKNLTDNSEKKLEYQEWLVPVVMYDPDMFDDVSSADINQLTVCAVWAIIKDDSIYPGIYETDDVGNIMIPQKDVNKKFAELFGTDVVPTHIGVKGYFDEFTYSEQSQCYLVTSTGSVPIYTPKVVDIKKGSNTVVLTVGYLAGEAWAQDTDGSYIEPAPTKYVNITLRENSDGYYISAMQATDAPENADPGETVVTAAAETTVAATTKADSEEN